MSTEALSVADLCHILNDQAETFAIHVLGEKPTMRSKTELRFFPKGGLSVYIAGPRKGHWTHYADGKFGDMLDLYKWRTGASNQDAIEFAKDYLNLRDGAPLPEVSRVSEAETQKELEEDEQKRIRTANWLWKKSSEPRGTPISAYFTGRGITIGRDGSFPSCIRYRKVTVKDLEKLNIDTTPYPNGLDGVTFCATGPDGSIRAIQTVLTHEGRKAAIPHPKRTNGVLQGAAVKLGEVTDTVIFAEGPETGLSLWQTTCIPTWIVLGTSNFTRVELPASVTTIIIAVDVEESGYGLASALHSAAYWRSQGKSVRLAIPTRKDFNDVLQDDGEEGVQTSVDHALAPANEDAPHDVWVLCQDPWDGLAIWLSTGINVRATVKDMVPERNIPEEARELIVVARPGENLPDFEPAFCRRHAGDALESIRYVRPSWLSVAQVLEQGDREAVSRLIDQATPHGMETLYGAEFLALKPHGRVILAQSRAAADTGATLLPDEVSIAYKASDANLQYDWSPLSNRDVYIAPAHCQKGIHLAACAAARINVEGARRISIIEWPLFVHDENGHRIRHHMLPRFYDMTMAANDGWKPEYIETLMSIAVPVS